MTLDFKNKNALICGSTAGIGKAIAKQLAEAGASITLVARDEAKLKATQAELLKKKHQNHDYIVVNFEHPDEVKTKIEAASSQKNYHILLNNTGGPKGGLIHEAKIEEFTTAFKMHLVCNQILVQALLPGMKTEGFGRILNIISTSVKQPIDGLGVSNTIRGAVANWSKTLANELGPYGITVNNVLPGFTATGRLDGIIANAANKRNSSEEEAANFMKSIVPARRFAKPEEVAYAAVFLASEQAGYINGINLPVDGGRTKSL